MFLHYLKTALRNLRKNPLYGAINVIGLSTGIAVCLLILVYVVHERSYDRFHKNSDRIFETRAAISFGDQVMQINLVSAPTGPIGLASSPHVRAFVRCMSAGTWLVYGPGGDRFFGDKFLLADSNFFRFFTFPLLEGNAATALAGPYKVVLSKRAAQKYFGRGDPVGKTLRCGKDHAFTVTGVAANPPSNSTIDFDFVLSMATAQTIDPYKTIFEWPTADMGSFQTFILLDRATDTAAVTRALTMSSTNGPNATSFKERFYLDPLTGLHLGQTFGQTAAVKYVNIFPLIAALILLLALINYMSLATARASVRAREIGVRKVIGAGRRTVAAQFYAESFLYALLAFSIGLGLFFVLEPWFSDVMHIRISPAFRGTLLVLGLMAALFVITVLASGSYPALILSAFRPIETLSGRMSNKRGGAFVRKTLTVLQFTIAATLIIFCWIVNMQLDHFRHLDGGLVRDRNVFLDIDMPEGSHFSAICSDLRSLAGVESVGASSLGLFGGMTAVDVKVPGESKPISLRMLDLDSNAFHIFGVRWSIRPSDPRVFAKAQVDLLNETAARRLGLYPNPLGKSIDSGWTRVDGVVRDFPFESPESAIKPLLIRILKDTNADFLNNGQTACWLILRLAPGASPTTTLASVEKTYHRYNPSGDFEYQFMDDIYNNLFATENRMAGLMDLFTALTILIACLGLFGLATFTAARRTKEIGIRKVLGAGVSRILGLLTREFVILVGLAILIACPIAGWCAARWMQGFANKIGLSPWVFAGAGLGMLALALGTVIVQAWRVARANPIRSLRTE